MNSKTYKPKIDKLFWSLFIPTNAVCIAILIIPSFLEPQVLFITVPIFLFVNYFFTSALFGYVELRDKELFIKYGFFIKKEIPYDKIRSLERCRKFYSHSMLSLKNSYDHIDIKYNFYDVTTVSVKEQDAFVIELEERIRIAKDIG